MTSRNTQILASWREEKRSAYLYRVLARQERASARGALFEELARAADEQARHWEDLLEREGGGVPQRFRPDLRSRVVGALVKLTSPRFMRPVLAAMKVRGMSLYAQAAPHTMPLRREDVGRRHQTGGTGTALRAGVFGVNDGLISNASLILGVAGAAPSSHIVLLSGVAGLLAGAFSMAAGEYISVRSQREMFEYQIGLEREELETYPQEEAAELALIYAAKGLPEPEAMRLAEHLIADPQRALDTLAREELGLNPEELGSPWQAAISSFAAFALGALVPLAPFFFGQGAAALNLSIGLTALALFAVGATLSLFTGRHALRGGLRMLLIGALAGTATYAIGHLLGVSLG